MTVKAEVRYCTHKGGTKFYQIWRVDGAVSSALVYQWGKNEGKWRESAKLGQVQLDECRGQGHSEAKARSKQRSKESRGYDRWDHWNHDFTDKEYETWVKEKFPRHLHEPLLELAGITVAPDDTPDPAPQPEPEPAVADEHMPDIWGSF